MMRTGRGAALAALLATIGVDAAAAQERSGGACLTRAEAEALTVFILPTLVEGVARKCKASLPAGATLTTQANSLSSRYRSDSANAWPTARAAFSRLSDDSITDLFGEEVTRTMIDASISSLIIERIALKDCGRIDQAVAALTPLPAKNVGKLVTVAVDALDDDGSRLPIALCTGAP